MRGRNRGKSHNPLTKVYESNGPDVKIRGTASHVAEKYIQLARDAQTSGDPVGAENYYQHAEHYFRMIAAAQEQFRQNAPFYGNRPDGNDMREGAGNDMRDGATFDDDGDEDVPGAGDQPQFGTRDPQPYLPRDAQFYAPNAEPPQQRQAHQGAPNGEESVDRLPSFITGGAQPQGQPQPQGGHENGSGERFQGDRGERGDRYGYRRRRHRRGGGPRSDMAGNGVPHEGDDSAH